jgi:hypothetical protein
VKLDGKPKWEIPTAKDQETDQWILGEPKGKLTFTFTCDPLEYKKELTRLTKEAAQAEAAGMPITDPAKLKPVAKELITESLLTKFVATNDDFKQTIEILMQNYKDQQFATNN